MDFFDQINLSSENILQPDGEAYYYGLIISEDKSKLYFKKLMESIQWENDKAIIFGKLITTKRKVSWYADKPYLYTYSKITKTAHAWNSTLKEIRNIIEEKSKEKFNSCLLNLYHDGSEGMAWHSDGEKDLRHHGTIASISFGAKRKFSFKNKKTQNRISLDLENGSLLIMKGVTQQNWLHRLPPTKKVQSPRINLTFRQIDK